MVKRTRIVLGSIVAASVMALAPVTSAVADTYWQCVPFARMISGVQIFGDARTWWKQAAGKYETGQMPVAGSVLCFKPTGKMRLGHVAVVSQVLTDRVIQITHANWSHINGSRGQIERDVTVVDVSANGDWSQVKVWYDPIRDLGSTTYPVEGFIYQDATAASLTRTGLATAQNTAVTVAQNAANQMAAAVRPGSGPLQMISQAAEATDRIATLLQQAGQTGSSGEERQ